MKKKKTRRVVIWFFVLVLLAVSAFVGYKIVLGYIGDMAYKKLISSQINTMLDTGEVTIEELEEIVEEPEEKTEEAPKTEDKKPQKEETPTPPSSEKKKEELVNKATEKVSEGVSRADKVAIARLIATRLTKEDVNLLMAMAADGLAGTEIRDAARIAKARFTSEELEQVKVFWHRYKESVISKKEK